jgi:hypothetical protein
MRLPAVTSNVVLNSTKARSYKPKKRIEEIVVKKD